MVKRIIRGFFPTIFILGIMCVGILGVASPNLLNDYNSKVVIAEESQEEEIISEFWQPENEMSMYATGEWVPISLPEELAAVKSNGKYYLTKDIDLSGKLWTSKSLGNGTLDGRGYSIMGLTQDDRCIGTGLFSSANGGTIKNLSLKSLNVTVSSGNVYGLLANGTNATIDRVIVESGILKSASGYAYSISNSGTKTNCYTNLNTKDYYNPPANYVGGIEVSIKQKIYQGEELVDISTFSEEEKEGFETVFKLNDEDITLDENGKYDVQLLRNEQSKFTLIPQKDSCYIKQFNIYYEEDEDLKDLQTITSFEEDLSLESFKNTDATEGESEYDYSINALLTGGTPTVDGKTLLFNNGRQGKIVIEAIYDNAYVGITDVKFVLITQNTYALNPENNRYGLVFDSDDSIYIHKQDFVNEKIYNDYLTTSERDRIDRVYQGLQNSLKTAQYGKEFSLDLSFLLEDIRSLYYNIDTHSVIAEDSLDFFWTPFYNKINNGSYDEIDFENSENTVESLYPVYFKQDENNSVKVTIPKFEKNLFPETEVEVDGVKQRKKILYIPITAQQEVLLSKDAISTDSASQYYNKNKGHVLEWSASFTRGSKNHLLQSTAPQGPREKTRLKNTYNVVNGVKITGVGDENGLYLVARDEDEDKTAQYNFINHDSIFLSNEPPVIYPYFEFINYNVEAFVSDPQKLLANGYKIKYAINGGSLKDVIASSQPDGTYLVTIPETVIVNDKLDLFIVNNGGGSVTNILMGLDYYEENETGYEISDRIITGVAGAKGRNISINGRLESKSNLIQANIVLAKNETATYKLYVSNGSKLYGIAPYDLVNKIKITFGSAVGTDMFGDEAKFDIAWNDTDNCLDVSFIKGFDLEFEFLYSEGLTFAVVDKVKFPVFYMDELTTGSYFSNIKKYLDENKDSEFIKDEYVLDLDNNSIKFILNSDLETNIAMIAVDEVKKDWENFYTSGINGPKIVDDLLPATTMVISKSSSVLSGAVTGKEIKGLSVFDAYTTEIDLSNARLSLDSGLKYELNSVATFYIVDGKEVYLSGCGTIKNNGNYHYTVTVDLNEEDLFKLGSIYNDGGYFEVRYVLQLINYEIKLEVVGGANIDNIKYQYEFNYGKTISRTDTFKVPYGTNLTFLNNLPTKDYYDRYSLNKGQLIAFHDTYGRLPISLDYEGNEICDGMSKQITNDLHVYIQVYNLRKVEFKTVIEVASESDPDVYNSSGKAITTGDIISLGGKSYKEAIDNFGVVLDWGIISGAGNFNLPEKVISEKGILYVGYQLNPDYSEYRNYNFEKFYVVGDNDTQSTYDEKGNNYRKFTVGEGTGDVTYYVAFVPQSYTIIYDNDVTETKIGYNDIPSSMTDKPKAQTIEKTYYIGTKYTFEEEFSIEGYELSRYYDWSYSSSDGQYYRSYNIGTTFVNLASAGGRVTLEASWTIIKFDIKYYNKDQKTVKETIEDQEYWTYFNTNVSAYVGAGYLSTGYECAKTGTKVTNETIVRSIYADENNVIKLYPVVKAVTFNVEYVYGENSLLVKNITYGNKTPFLTQSQLNAEIENFIPEGYTLVSWTDSINSLSFLISNKNLDNVVASCYIIDGETVILNASLTANSYDLSVEINEYKKNVTGLGDSATYPAYKNSLSTKINFNSSKTIYFDFDESVYEFDGIYRDSEYKKKVELNVTEEKQYSWSTETYYRFTTETMGISGLNYYIRLVPKRYNITYSVHLSGIGGLDINSYLGTNFTKYYLGEEKILPTIEDIKNMPAILATGKNWAFEEYTWVYECGECQTAHTGLKKLPDCVSGNIILIGDLVEATSYTVNNYIESLYGREEYDVYYNNKYYCLEESETLYELAGKQINLLTDEKYINRYEGCTLTYAGSGKVASDGSTVLNNYYTRDSRFLYLYKNVEDEEPYKDYERLYGAKEYLPTLANNGDYLFLGWTDDAKSSKVKYKGGDEYYFTSENQAVELFALWEHLTYTIVFNGNKADSGTMENMVVGVSESIVLPKNAFVNGGYYFIGWSTSSNGSVMYNNCATVSKLASKGQTITLYAIWQFVIGSAEEQPKSITKTYDGNSAEVYISFECSNSKVLGGLTFNFSKDGTNKQKGSVEGLFTWGERFTATCILSNIKNVNDSGKYIIELVITESKYSKSITITNTLDLKIEPREVNITLNNREFDGTDIYLQEIEVEEINETIYVKSQYPSSDAYSVLTNKNFEFYYDEDCTQNTNNYKVGTITGSSTITSRQLNVNIKKEIEYRHYAQTFTEQMKVVDGYTLDVTYQVSPRLPGSYEGNPFSSLFVKVTSFEVYGQENDAINFEVILSGEITIYEATVEDFDFTGVSVTANSLIFNGADQSGNALNIQTNKKPLTPVISFYNDSSRRTKIDKIVDVGTYYARVVFTSDGYDLSDRQFDCEVTISPREISVTTKKDFDKVFDGQKEYSCLESDVEISNVAEVIGYKFEDLGLIATYQNVNAGETKVVFSCKNKNYTTKSSCNVTINKNDLIVKFTKDFVKTYDRQVATLIYDTDFIFDSGYYGETPTGSTLTISIVDAGVYRLEEVDAGKISLSTNVSNYNVKFENCNLIIVPSSVVVETYVYNDKTYSGTEQKLPLQLQGESLEAGKEIWIKNEDTSGAICNENDFTTSYLNGGKVVSPINAGEYTFRIEFSNNFTILIGNEYKNVIDIPFVIHKRNITKLDLGESNETYTGEIIEKTVSLNTSSENVENLLSNHTLNVIYQTSSSEVGRYVYGDDEKYITISSIEIINANNELVTENYEIEENIISVILNIVAYNIENLEKTIGVQEKVFNGRAQTYDFTELDKIIEAFNAKNGLNIEITKQYQILNGVDYEDIESESVINVGNYRVELKLNVPVSNLPRFAYLVINPRQISISLKDGKSFDREYDNTTDIYVNLEEYLNVSNVKDVTGYKFSDLGLLAKFASAVVVQDNYVIISINNNNYTLSKNILAGKVTTKELLINLGNVTKTFDRNITNITVNNFMTTGLASGHNLEGYVTFNTIDAETYTLSNKNLDISKLAVGIYTNNYAFKVQGTLTIKPAVIELFFEESELTKTYNGMAQQVEYNVDCSDCTIDSVNDFAITYNGLNTLPINAGIYKFKVESLSDNFVIKYNGEENKYFEFDFEIKKIIIEQINVGNLSANYEAVLTISKQIGNEVNYKIISGHILDLTLTISNPELRTYNLSTPADREKIEIIINSFTGGNANVIDNYDLTNVEYLGTITVNKNDIPSDIILPQGLTVVYDGEAHSIKDSFDAAVNYFVSQGSEITYTVNGEDVSEFGEFTNAGTYLHRITATGFASVVEALLTISPREISLNAQPGKDLNKSYDGKDIFPTYKLNENYIEVGNVESVAGYTFADLHLSAKYKYSYVMTGNEVIVSISNANYRLKNLTVTGEIVAKELVVNLGSHEKTFDNQSYTIELSSSMTEGLISGHTLVGSATVNEVDADTYDLSTLQLTYTYDISGNKNNYTLTFVGSLVIKPAEIVVTYNESDFRKTYNATKQTPSIKLSENSLFKNEYMAITFDGVDAIPTDYKEGGYEYRLSLVTNNFVFVVDGQQTTEITERFYIEKLTLTSVNIGYQSASKDSSQLILNVEAFNIETLADLTHRLTLTISVSAKYGVYTLPNNDVTVDSFTVYDGNGSDISYNYHIEDSSLRGQVTYDEYLLPSSITLADETYTFDGKEKTLINLNTLLSQLEGYGITNYSVKSFSSLDNIETDILSYTNAGEYIFKVYLNAGSLYPEYLSAKLTINKRQLFIAYSGEFDKVYDGNQNLPEEKLANIKIQTLNRSSQFVSLDEVITNHNIKINASYSTFNAGKVSLTISLLENVVGTLSNYNFEPVVLETTIIQKDLIFTAESMPDFYYNESAYKANLTNFKCTGLVDGQTITAGDVTFINVINYNSLGYDISEELNQIANFAIKNSDDEVVLTSNYNVKFEGTIFVKKAQLKVIEVKLDDANIPEKITYNAQEHFVSANVEIADGKGYISNTENALEVTYDFADTFLAKIDCSSVRDAGTYKISFALNEILTQNYELIGETEKTLLVEKFELNIDLNSNAINQTIFKKQIGETDSGIIISYFVEATNETIENIKLSRETGEDIGTYDVYLSDEYKNNNYAITILNGTDKFEIIKILENLLVEILASENNLNLFSKIYDAELVPAFENVTLDYKTYLGSEEVTALLTFEKIVFVNNTANVGKYSLNYETSIISSTEYANIVVTSCPEYEIKQREIILEKTSWDKEYDGTNAVDFSGVTIKNYADNLVIDATTKYYPTLTGTYAQSDAIENCEIYISAGGNFKVIGKYTGTINQIELDVIATSNQTSEYGNAIEITYNIYKDSELYNSFKEELVKNSVKLILAKDLGEVSYSSSGNIVVGTYNIMFNNNSLVYNLTNFKLNLTAETYVITPKTITVEGEISKIYKQDDAEINLNLLVLKNVVANDKVELSSLTFESDNVGESVVKFTITGNDSANYLVEDSKGTILNRVVTLIFDYSEKDLINASFMKNNQVERVNLNYGEDLASLTLPAPTHEGYEFKGWKIGDINLDNTFVIEEPNWLIDEKEKTAYAVWEIKKFNVTLEAYDSESMAGGSVTLKNTDYDYGTEIDLYSKTDEVYDNINISLNEGYELASFILNELIIEKVKVIKDTTIYFDINEISKILSLDAGDGVWNFSFDKQTELKKYGWEITQKIASKTFKYYDKVNLADLLPNKKGYTFSGWSDSKFNTETKWERVEDYTITANYTANSYKLTLNAGIGEFAEVDENVWTKVTNEDDKVIAIYRNVEFDSTIGKVVEPTKKGYEFVRWLSAGNSYTTENLSKLVWNYVEDQVFNAVFDEKLYKIYLGEDDSVFEYNVNIESEIESSSAVYDDYKSKEIEVSTTNKINIIATAKTGYIFNSWVVQDLDGEDVSAYVTINKNTISIDMSALCKDVKVYATYTLADITVTVKTNNASWGNVVIGEKSTDESNPEIKVIYKTEDVFQITLVANEGYELSLLELPEELKTVTAGDKIIVSNFFEDFTINAIFKKSVLQIKVQTQSIEKGYILVGDKNLESYVFTKETGDLVEFRFIANHGYTFDRVEFETASSNKGTIVVDENLVTLSDHTSSGVVTVYFKKVNYALTVKTLLFDADNTERFTESVVGGSYTLKVNDEESVNGEYVFESKVEISATSNHGYHFVSYSSSKFDFSTNYDLENLVIENENISFTLSNDATIYVVFEINSYTVTFDTDGNGVFKNSLISYTEKYKHGEELDFNSINTYGNIGYEFDKWIQVIDDENKQYQDVVIPTIITTDKHFRVVFTNKQLSASVYAQLISEDRFDYSITDAELLESIKVVQDENYFGHTQATYDNESVLTPLIINSKNGSIIKLELSKTKGYEFDHIEVTVGNSNFEIEENIISLSNFATDFKLIVFFKAISYDLQVEFVDEDGKDMSSAGFISLLTETKGAVMGDDKTSITVKHGGLIVFNIYALNGYYFADKDISKINIESLEVSEIQNSPIEIYSQTRKLTVVPNYSILNSNSVIKLTVSLSRVVYELQFIYNYPMTSNSEPEFTAFINYGETNIYNYSDYTAIVTPPDMPVLGATHTFLSWAETNTGFGRHYYFDGNGEIYYYENNVKVLGWNGILQEEFNGEKTHTVTLYGVWKLITHEIAFKINSPYATEGDVAKFATYENIRVKNGTISAVENTFISIMVPTLKEGYLFKGYKVYATKTNELLYEGDNLIIEFTMPNYEITVEYFVEVRVSIEADGEGQVSFGNNNFVNNAEMYYVPFDANVSKVTISARSALAYEISHWLINGDVYTESTDIFEISYNAEKQTSTLILKEVNRCYDIKAVFIGKIVEIKVIKHEFGLISKINNNDLKYSNGEAYSYQRVGTRLIFTFESEYGYELDEIENYGKVSNITVEVEDRNGMVLKPKFKARQIMFEFKIMENVALNNSAGYIVGVEENQVSYPYGAIVRIEWLAKQRYKFASKVLFNGTVVQTENNTLIINTKTNENIVLGVNTISVYFEKLMWLEEGKALVETGNIFSGAGTANSPYIISTTEQISALAYLINIQKDTRYAVSYYKLASSMSLIERFWVPIGTEENPFDGTFIFASYSVSDIKLDKYYSTIYHEGLFGVCGPNAKFKLEESGNYTVYIVFGSIIAIIIIFITAYVIIRIKKRNRLAMYSETRLK